MKKMILVLSLTFCALVKAYAAEPISFSIGANFLYSGKVKVYTNMDAQFAGFVTISRQFLNPAGYETVNMQVRVVVVSGGTVTNVTDNTDGFVPFTTADFSSVGLISLDKVITGRIPLALSSSGNVVRLEYRNFTGVWSSWTPTLGTYQTQVIQDPYEGKLLMDQSTGQQHIIIDGFKRHVQNMASLETLCVNGRNYIYYYSTNTSNPFYNMPVGPHISLDMNFIKHTATQKIYWREGTYIRYITSPAAGDKYQFRWMYPVSVSSIAGYTEGPHIVY